MLQQRNQKEEQQQKKVLEEKQQKEKQQKEKQQKENQQKNVLKVERENARTCSFFFKINRAQKLWHLMHAAKKRA